MRPIASLKSFSAVVLGLAALARGSPISLTSRAIDQATFDDLTFYFQYASSAYLDTCASPNGNTVVTEFHNTLTDTQGFIARDDNRREIVVSLRGSTSLTDFLGDAEIPLIPFISPGVNAPLGSLAHTGFLTAWNSVVDHVLSVVGDQLAAHPDYSLVSSGHSLGGALSSLAAITLQQNFPDRPTRMFTYGQPRTFNPIGAEFINDQLGTNVFRAVHTSDGVPTLVPRILGYKHHGIEYWQNPDPPSPETTKKCDADGEDPTCSDSIPPSAAGIIAAHGTYFGIGAGTAFC